ncbi:Zinc finger (C3HC4-type RING finger) family protein [Rhynchospora pubera]|uniref:Zinc finger (C3HC4-type RING finger) family protein n=1 Tax=Rhynchospora pubera TaxID=906938 RepID=A0AAV8DV95_9POAL|nr:Zinc finger (C3HC4-type RING finger) family protein [Rhynchospora pubera]
MGRGWRRMMLFGRDKDKESKAPSENGGASICSTPRSRNRDRELPLKLNLFSAFRTSSHHTTNTTKHASSTAATSINTKESNLGSTPSSLHCHMSSIKTHVGCESESASERGDVLLEWEAPSPVKKWRSRTPPPLSKLKKSFSSLFQSSYSSSSSTPSSPKSPSPFSLFKSSVLSSKQIKCEKCGGNMKRVQGMRDGDRGCSVCSPLSPEFDKHSMIPQDVSARKPVVNYKAYNDDEPLTHSNMTITISRSGSLQGSTTPPPTFNPIPEADEEEFDSNSNGIGDNYEESEGDETRRDDNLIERHERQSIMSGTSTSNGQRSNISVSVLPEAALVSSGRRHMSYVVAVRVKAPPVRSASEAASRAPMDLVAVLEVSPEMSADKLLTLKQTIRPIIASMGLADRLSIVAFSGSTTKRLMPLRRMTKQGQRTARQIVDRLVVCSAAQQSQVMLVSASDALKKAKKVLEDRRECNPVATIMLLSDKRIEQRQQSKNHPSPSHNDATRFVHLEFPPALGAGSIGEEEEEDPLTKCIGQLASVVMQEVRLQFVLPSGEGEVTAVYCNSLNGSGSCSKTGGTGSSISLGDLHAGQEVELLLELRVPLNQRRHSLSFCVKCTYRDPVTMTLSSGVQQPPLLLPPVPVQNSSLRLRNLFITFRAVVESRRLVGLNDFATALHLLYSARSLLLQCPPSTVQDLVPNIEAELVEIQRRRGVQQQQHQLNERQWQVPAIASGGGREPLTPTSAWRAAEQLAKVAIMRKSQNRVSDLHGFENARF